jgi:hypothetical protein
LKQNYDMIENGRNSYVSAVSVKTKAQEKVAVEL